MAAAVAVPFTPFHFGPGLLFKSLSPARFSFLAFVATQVVIDVETLVNIFRQAWPLHRFLHSIPGGLLAGTAVAVSIVVLRRSLGEVIGKAAETALPGTAAALAGALVGGFSHAVLDDVMHQDTKLFYPSAVGPDLQGLVGVGALHLGCLISGVAGLALWAVRAQRVNRG